MKCVSCGNKSEDGHLLCAKCKGVEHRLPNLSVHTCSSFFQKEGEATGICQNAIFCEPMKSALMSKSLIVSQLGHIICPHASINLSYLVYGEFDEETLMKNYKELFD